MTFQPGQSGNPAGNTGHSTRRKGTREAFEAIKNAGYIDPLVNLAKIQHEGETESIRTSAAAALVPYVHPKLQSIPVPRFIDRPFKIPVFQTIDDAKNFLASIPNRIAAGELDLDFADSLTKSTVAWLQLQYAEMGIDLKAAAQGASDRDTTIRILGGLPVMPGCENLMMPTPEQINGNRYELPPPPSTLNPSSIDGVHTAEPHTPTVVDVPNAPAEPDPT
jgi:hypothetical protein